MRNENCPCKKKSCPRHGDCEACRSYHAASKRKRPVFCEKNIAVRKFRSGDEAGVIRPEKIKGKENDGGTDQADTRKS